MSRLFAPITEEELANKIYKAAIKHEYYEEGDKDPNNFSSKIEFIYEERYKLNFVTLTPTIKKDLEKVEFDSENLSADPYECSDNSDTLVGFHTLSNGFTFLGIEAGGDWEHPVFFIIYWDGKTLRGYIPEDGNVYNSTTKKAYGNAKNDEDEKDIFNKYGKDISGESLIIDYNKIKKDIMNRILSTISEGVTPIIASVQHTPLKETKPPEDIKISNTIKSIKIQEVILKIEIVEESIKEIKDTLYKLIDIL